MEDLSCLPTLGSPQEPKKPRVCAKCGKSKLKFIMAFLRQIRKGK